MPQACETQYDSTTLGLFEQQVRDAPEAIAVVFEECELNYAQLNGLANQFATALEAAGIGHGDRVGLCIERSPEAIAAMLGAFKLGAVFVPLDSGLPLQRIEFMLQDAGIRTLITSGQAENPIATQLAQSSLASELTWIDSRRIEFANLEPRFTSCDLKPNDLAYIMYTSGSTGNPKGVQIEHLALTTYCMADIEVYQLRADDRTLQFSTLCFDIAIEEIFPPLLIGSCVVIRPAERGTAANELSQIINHYQITAIHLATAYWHEWVDLLTATKAPVPASLRLVIATGEKVSVEHYRRWLERCQHEVLWCNAYGPTEATVTATVFIPGADFCDEQMPIGRALPGYEAWILDEDFGPVADGETGQLYISGPALARGYLNRDDLNQAAFITLSLADSGPQRLYRTGDLARWLPDGNIDFAGRVDHQIKLGSYRIEPGEIEAALNKHPAVKESLVLYEQVGSQKYLFAYVAVINPKVSVDSLASHLSQHLPVYMVPTRYVLMSRFEKTINGKVDRRVLPDPSTARIAARTDFVEPATPMQHKLAKIWQSVLQVSQVGQHDDFFLLGGSSLLVTRVIAQLTNEYDLQLPVRDFFANPTLSELAAHLATLVGESEPSDSGADLHTDMHRRRGPHLCPEYFPAGDNRLFSVRYEPRLENGIHDKQHCVLLCHSVGAEYARAYRNLQQLAAKLCNAGYTVMRFDYFGCGNSPGDDDQLRVHTMQADVRSAAEHLRRSSGYQRLSLLGVRLGATIAATAGVADLENLILWDPVINGDDFTQHLDALHHHALTSQTRFPQLVTTAEPGQAYGHGLCNAKRESLSSLSLPAPELLSDIAQRHLIITSENYAITEPHAADLCQLPNWQSTSDQIYWHAMDYTESAFSSPGAFAAAVDCLQGESHGPA